MLYRLPKNPSAEQMQAAYDAGLLRKENLVDRAYYQGRCRNARVARWSQCSQCFVYWRNKFGGKFLERICHPVDEPLFDVFLASQQVEPGEDVIDDEAFDVFLAKKSQPAES